MSPSDEAVLKATGRSWRQWRALLDRAGAARMSHREIVRWLASRLPSSWWQQSLTVEYEKSLQRRQVGETADSGFQIGVQRTLPFPAPPVWELLLSPRGLAVWLGRTGRLRLAKGARYRTREGASGELRALAPGGYLRLSWQPPGWEKPSIIALRLLEKSGRTAVHFHQERLPDAQAREAMRARWKSSLERIARMLPG
jgi:uncharacterized protein YndB with AHSA1/START domain